MGASLSWSISESNVSTANNTSKVTVTLKITATGSTWNGYSQSGWIKIDGTKYTFSHSFAQGKTTTLATKSKTVTHNSDGSKSCSISCSYNTGVSPGTLTKSTTKTLTKIARNFTVTLDPNGGAISGKTDNTTKTKAYGTNLTLPTPTRANYTFKGWTTTRVTNTTNWGTNYNTTYTANAAVTLYAAWWSNYNIIYNGNGNTGGSTATSSHIWGVKKQLTANGFTKTGHTFNQWYPNSSGTGSTHYANKEQVTSLSNSAGGKVNLYATWNPISYQISYNLNGGTGTTPSSQNVTYDTSITLPSINSNVQYTGYAFAGWSTIKQDTNTTPQYEVGDKFIVTKNQTFYAVWVSAAVSPSINIEARRVDAYGQSSTGGKNISYKINYTKAKTYDENQHALVQIETSATATASTTSGTANLTNLDGTIQVINSDYFIGQEITISVTATPKSGNPVTKTLKIPYVNNSTPFQVDNVQIIPEDSNLKISFNWKSAYDGHTNEDIQYIHLFYKASTLDPDTGEVQTNSNELIPWNSIPEGDSADYKYDNAISNGFFEKIYTLPSDFEERELFIFAGATKPTAYNPEITYYRIGETSTGSLIVHIPPDQRGIGLFGIVRPEEKGLIVNNAITVGPGMIDNNDLININNTQSDQMVSIKGKDGISIMYAADCVDTGASVKFGIGNGGINHGIWSTTLNKWLIHGNTENVFMDGIRMTPYYTTTVNNVLTVSTGVTILKCQYYQWGKMAQLYLNWQYDSSISATAVDGNITNIIIGTLSSDKKPATPIAATSYGDNAGLAFYLLNSVGTLQLCSIGAARTIDTSKQLQCCVSYILA